MVCQAAVVVELATTQPAVRTVRPATRRVCLPPKYAGALARGHFVVTVNGKPVAVSVGTVR